MKKSTALAVGILAVSLLGAGFVAKAVAHPMERGGMESISCDDAPFHHGGRMMGKNLGLTDTQRERIKEIFSAQSEQRGEKMQALEEIRKELKKQAFSDNFDPAQVQTLSKRQAELAAELQVARTTALHEFYQTLNEQQKQKLAEQEEKQQEHAKGRGDWRSHH
ncbi:MAG: Spy/CpxP family protein refolding chaperone [Chromatiales bacterium]|nr:Spy/CpxP family protein refolding chaperone [Chromatiales bacterium]